MYDLVIAGGRVIDPAQGLDGRYDVAFLNDSPRVSHCFEIAAETNAALKEKPAVGLRIEHQSNELKLTVGQEFTFRFKLIDTASGTDTIDSPGMNRGLRTAPTDQAFDRSFFRFSLPAMT